MSHMLAPQVILLKEGTDTSQGKPQLISNINACTAVADVVRTTLGPRGMDKLVHDDKGKVTISNDGATIMKLLDVVHPAAKTLVDISLSQDSEVGDGTTTVVLLAAELLREAKAFIDDGVHPRSIIRSYREACRVAVAELHKQSVSLADRGPDEKRNLLRKCAETTMNSKLIASEKEFFSEMVVDAVSCLDPAFLDPAMIGVKKVTGAGLRDSYLCKGVAFKKTFSYAGFEQQPKSFQNPKILLLNIELELKAERENAEIRLSDPTKYQSIVDAEWTIIYEKLANCHKSGAQIVLSRLAIGDLATQYFADRGIFCAGRVTEEDLQRVAKATGARTQTTVNNLDLTDAGFTSKCYAVLGTCGSFEERQVGAERFNHFVDCPEAKSATMVLRGGSEQFIDEVERSLHDAIMIVRRAFKNSDIVAGGGAVDMELSRALRQHARTMTSKGQIFVNSYAKALEVIPRQLCNNAGFDANDVLNKLRQKHHFNNAQFGVDVSTGGVVNTFEAFVWEPKLVKLNALQSATEAACLVLSVDETVQNPASAPPDGGPVMPGRGAGRGRGMGRGRMRR